MHLNPVALPAILCAAVLYRLGIALERRANSRKAKIWLFAVAVFLATPCFLFALYYTHLFDNAAWFYRFRALPYSELVISASGLLAGSVYSWFAPETFGERIAIPVSLFVFLAIPFVKPILDPINLDLLRDSCDGEVCMQSTLSTCGPSSSATILKAFGQKASEKQLARECLTSRGGTEVWYIARAFERRGFHAIVQIQPEGNVLPPSPAIAGVVLPGGAGHFIAILSQNAQDVAIGDPMKGKLTLKKSQLRSYYNFTGFFLVIQPN